MSEGMLSKFKGRWNQFRLLMRVQQSVRNWKEQERFMIERGIKPPNEGLMAVRELKKGFEEVLSFFENPTSKDEDWEKCFRKLNKLIDREKAIFKRVGIH